MTDDEPHWLRWARELQAHAQSGLTFTKDPFDRERYEQIRSLAADMVHVHTGEPFARVETLFSAQSGYATPKVDVRAAVFDDRGQILMVRETADGGRWTLPGGWADVNVTPADNAVKEVWEESGYELAVTKLAASGTAPGKGIRWACSPAARCSSSAGSRGAPPRQVWKPLRSNGSRKRTCPPTYRCHG